MKNHLTQARIAQATALALTAAAQELERAAANLRRDATTADHSVGWHRKMGKLPDMLDLVRHFIEMGDSEAAAIERVAACSDVRADFLAAHWTEEHRLSRRARNWRRDREVLRLAWLGGNNAEIAARVGLSHGNSVSRIISKHLRKRSGFSSSYVPHQQLKKEITHVD